MGIFNKKNEVETNITFEDTPSGKRKYNVLLDVVNSITETKPEVALALTENIPESPALYRVRGWAFAEIEDLENCIATFEKGWQKGDVGCGVYLHRLYRDLHLDEEKFLKLDSDLLPFFESKDISLVYAQVRLALKKNNYSAAINNVLGITFQQDSPTKNKYGATFYSVFMQLMEHLTNQLVPNIEKITEDDVEKVWEEVCDFFDTGITTAEGDALGWSPFIYFYQISEYIFREITEGNYGSASVLTELNEFYKNLIEQVDPPIPPRTFTTEEIWETLLKSLEHGDLHSIYAAGTIAEGNKSLKSEIKVYEDEFKSWNFERYLM